MCICLNNQIDKETSDTRSVRFSFVWLSLLGHKGTPKASAVSRCVPHGPYCPNAVKKLAARRLPWETSQLSEPME